MTYYKLNKPDVSAEYSDNEVLAINLKTGHYHSLRNTAVVFFRLLLDGNSSEESVRKIAEVYAINFQIATKDMNQFITELLKNNLIVKITEAIPNPQSDWLKEVADEYSIPVLENYTDIAESETLC